MKALFLENDLRRVLLLKAFRPFLRSAPVGRFFPVQHAEVPEPDLPGRRWLKVRVKSCGLCGSDVHFLHLDMDPKCFPAAIPGLTRKYLGHELVGEVTETGSEVENFLPGDRVALRIDWPSCYQLEIDPPCDQCRAGNYMLCENLGKKEISVIDTGGGFSPWMVMHRSQPYKIPDSLDDHRALLLEPMASAVHGVMKRPPVDGDNILVIGGGTIGLLCVLAVKTMSPASKVTCLARYPFQAEAATMLGADHVIPETDGVFERVARLSGGTRHQGYFGNEIVLGGFDTVYDSVGSNGSIHDGLRWVRGGGDFVLLGINFKPGKIDYSPIWCQEIRVTGINCHADESRGGNSFDMAARLLSETPFPVEKLITHRFPMPEFRTAVKTFMDKKQSGAVKIVLDHE
jgi:threonine dehydrogenase-like Zn-dependent dehydrogenase